MSTVFNLAYLAVIGGLALVLYRLCRDPRPSEQHRAAEASARVGLPAPDDRQFIADLKAQMKAYGAEVADFYDTTTGDQS